MKKAHSNGGTGPPIDEAIERIEAALQAALGAEAGARPQVARSALDRSGVQPDAQLEAWLEAVAAEIQSSSAVLVPEDMIEAIAERLLADRGRLLEAHGKISGETIQNLVRRP